MPVRIYDIARQFGIESSEVLEIAKGVGISGKAASSTLNPVDAEKLEKSVRMILDERRARGLRRIQLSHFKAFADMQSALIRPLTLIFGANSSGKSSVIHSLLLARHALDTGEVDVSRTEIGGDSVDLGGFNQYVHRRDVSQRVELALELQTNVLRGNARRFLKQGQSATIALTLGIPLDNLGKPVRGEKARLMAYDVECGGRSVLRLSLRPDKTMQLDRLDNEIILPLVEAIVLQNTTIQALELPAEREALFKTAQSMISTLRFTCRGLLPNQLVGEESSSTRQPQLIPIGRDKRTEELENAARLFIPRAIADLIRNVNDALQSEAGLFSYLGPLRSYPSRHLAFNEDRDRNWLAGGGYAWDLVRTNWAVRDMVNKWLGSSERLKTPYRLEIERYFTASDIQAGLDAGFSKVAEDIVAELTDENKPKEDQPARILVRRNKLDVEQSDLAVTMQ